MKHPLKNSFASRRTDRKDLKCTAASSSQCEELKAPGLRPFLLLLLVFALGLAFYVVLPFIHPIIMAVVLASLFTPIHTRILKLLKGRKTIASLITVAVITAVIIIPFFGFLTALVDQGVHSVNKITSWVNSGGVDDLVNHPVGQSVLEWLRTRLSELGVQDFNLNEQLLQAGKRTGSFLLDFGTGFMSNTAKIITNFFVMIFILFYIVRDGHAMVDIIKEISPLSDKQEDRILLSVRAVARSVFLGSFLTAIAQGLAGGIGFAIVGIPAVFWGAMLGFASLVPVVGTALVWIPAVVYLLIFGKWLSALFLGIWCAVLVGSIDNFLRPYLMHGSAKLSPFYIFLALLGGMSVFGIPGLLYGPLIFGFAMVMITIYRQEFQTRRG